MNFNGVKVGGSGPMLTGIVATGQCVAYGSFVTISATDGRIQMASTGTTVQSYLGVANDDIVMHDYDGFYDAGDKVPIITNGMANAWILGGQTVKPGDHLKFPGAIGSGTEYIGVLYPETTLNRSLASVARYVGSTVGGDADFDQSCTVSGKVLTIDSAQHLTDLELVEGDFVVLASSEGAEVNTIADPDTSTTTCTLNKTPLVTHTTSPKVYKLEQILVQLE